MIHLKLARIHFNLAETIGNLVQLDKEGEETWLCYTLEDRHREIEGKPVSEWKIQGKTAIPVGKYPLVWSFSRRFAKFTLEIREVPGFSGIRVHSGNTSDDTEGCVLVGMSCANTTIGRSRDAVKFLEKLLESLGTGEKTADIVIE